MRKLREADEAIDRIVEQALDVLQVELKGELDKLRASYEAEVDAILGELNTKVASIKGSTAPAETPEAPAEPEENPLTHSSTVDTSKPIPTIAEPESGARVVSPGPDTPRTTASRATPRTASGGHPSWRSTWHGPVLNPEPDMHADDYMNKYGKNEPSWRKTLRYQGLSGLAKRVWRGTNPMQDIAWRYANHESTRGLPTINEYIEFKKIADYHVNQYLPLNESDDEIAAAVKEASDRIKKALSNFMLQVTATIRPRLAALLKKNSSATPPALPSGGSSSNPLSLPVVDSKKKNQLSSDEIQRLEDEKKKAREQEELQRPAIIKRMKIELVAEIIEPHVLKLLNTPPLELINWFKWGNDKNPSFRGKDAAEVEEKQLTWKKNNRNTALKDVTNNKDGLLELAGFLKFQGIDLENASDFLKFITKGHYTGTTNILGKVIHLIGKNSLPDIDGIAKELEKRLGSPLEFHTPTPAVPVPASSSSSPSSSTPIAQAANDADEKAKEAERLRIHQVVLQRVDRVAGLMCRRKQMPGL